MRLRDTCDRAMRAHLERSRLLAFDLNDRRTGWLDLPRFNLPRTQAKAKKCPLEVLGVPCTLDIPMRQANCARDDLIYGY